MGTSRVLAILMVSFVVFSSFALAASVQAASNPAGLNLKAPASGTSGSFAFVSEFNNGGNIGDYGWTQVQGNGNPSISSTVNYFGEPSLELNNGQAVATNENVSREGQFVSFQVAVNAASGSGTFSIVNALGAPIAWLDVSGNTIAVGAAGGNATVSGNVPSQSAYHTGWVYLSGNLYNSSSKKQFGWTLQVFVDATNSVFATVSAPLGYSYAGIELSSSSHRVFFTNVYFTSYEIPAYIPGYNNMEGYGQGSGLIVSLLPQFTILHANMILYNWSVPRTGILSFQINAMNYYGATRSTCKGFFQLGIDINPNGMISPWYVKGTNCIAHYFLNSSNPSIQPGFASPSGTVLGLTIEDDVANNSMLFQIVDYSMTGGATYWNATIPYGGTELYGSYTQLEFQPFAEPQIMSYHFNGTIYNMTYGSSWTNMIPLNNSYMLPSTLDAPSTWSLTYYDGQTAAYDQTS